MGGMDEWIYGSTCRSFRQYVKKVQSLNLIANLIMMDELKPETFRKELVSLANGYKYFSPEALQKLEKPGPGGSVYYRANRWLYVGIAPAESPEPVSMKKALYEVTLRGEEIHVIINLPEVIHHRCSISTLPANGAIMIGMFGPDFIKDSADAARTRNLVPWIRPEFRDESLPFEVHHLREMADLVEGRKLTELEIRVSKALDAYFRSRKKAAKKRKLNKQRTKKESSAKKSCEKSKKRLAIRGQFR